MKEDIMFIRKKVRDIMVPIKEYALTCEDCTLAEAILDMRKIYCQVEAGKCTEAGHRTSLVVSDGKLVGIIDFMTILKVLIPEIAGGLSKKLEALSVSVAFAEAGAQDLDERNAHFRERVLSNAQTKVGDIMLKLRGTVEADAYLIDALKALAKHKVTVLPVFEGKELVGVLRDSDLFLAAARILTE